MGNCLITKLKAVVNNPDLPIIEMMQQFTLNAIAASGNNSMTDAQKMALNHFFLTIGAPDNSGIWTKLDAVFMPFIAGSKDKAIIDYKTNTSEFVVNDSTTALENGYFSNTTGTVQQVKTIPSINTADISWLKTHPSGQVSNPTTAINLIASSSSAAFVRLSNSNKQIVGVRNNVSASTSFYIYRSIIENASNFFGEAMSYKLNGTDNLSLFKTEDAVTEQTTFDTTPAAEGQVNLTVTDGVLTLPSYLGFRTFILGESLSRTELRSLFNAVFTLQTAFGFE